MSATALKVQAWSEDEFSEILKERLQYCVNYRKENFENGWKANEGLLYKPNGDPSLNPTLSYSSLAEVYQAQAANTQKIHVPRVAQNLRFLHSQMSANPPSVIPQATSNEDVDKAATAAADDLIRYGRKQYKLQEHIDLTSLSTLTYGTGIVKVWHDPTAGEVLTFDEESDVITMAGDFKCRPKLIWDFWFDYDPECWDDVRYTFERYAMPIEQALSRWPDFVEVLMNNLVDITQHPQRISTIRETKKSILTADERRNATVEIFEYVEKASPTNGMAGRRCFHVADGTILGSMEKNPYPEGRLPYGILTDIDVPGEVYGKTTVDYAIGLAKIIDSLQNMLLNNVELHGSIKLVVFDQSETNEEDYSDDPIDIITVNGTHAHAPYQLKPASVSSDVYNMMNQMYESIDGIMGVNELLKGQINRELSGFASQTAINAANMVRHRLFNKYTALVEFVYAMYLMSVRDNWKTRRKLKILGTEDGPTLRDFEGADLAGGYVLTVEYGANFSLDPAMRREELMQSREVMLEAGVSPKKFAQMLRYNEIDHLFDAIEVSKRRQIEIFTQAIELYKKTGEVRVEPASRMRKAFHLEMAEAATEYVMKREFLDLDEDIKEAIYDHIDEREQLAAQSAAPPQGLPGQPPAAGPAPLGPPLPQVPDIGGVLT